MARQTISFRSFVAAGVTGAVLALLVPGTASAATCARTPDNDLAVTAGPNEMVEVAVASGAITVGGTGCAGSTVHNTRMIRLTATDLGEQRFYIDQRGGRFAPGLAFAEAAGSTPEIEFEIDAGSEDSIIVRGTQYADTMSVGSLGASLNADADQDMAFVGGVRYILLWGEGGNDRLSAMGGYGSGTAAPAVVNADLQGNLGNDTLLPGPGTADNIGGGPGVDTVSYVPRAAGVSVTLDGAYDDGSAGENDRVDATVENVIGTLGADRFVGSDAANSFNGRAGNDTASGRGGNDTLVGGPGADTLAGGYGNDTFGARDALRDTVTGGAGTDSARLDATDIRSSIERLLA